VLLLVKLLNNVA